MELHEMLTAEFERISRSLGVCPSNGWLAAG